ncbi:MAG: TolC family protein [Ginsengibacter sp.]
MYRTLILCLCFVIALSSGVSKANAQDTTYMSIQIAQNIFTEQNLDMIAARFEIDKASAQIMQSRLLNNPEFEITANAYNPEDKKFFDVSNRTGDYGFRLEQLFSLGGKIRKATNLAQTQYDYTQHSFSALLRDLLFSLRTNFHTLNFLQESQQKLKMQLDALKNLSASYDRLQKKQLVTLQDAFRVKSLYYSLLSEITDIDNQMEDNQNQLRVLLNLTNKTIVVETDNEEKYASFPDKYSLSELLDSAHQNRPDLKMARKNILINEHALILERSLAIPNLKVGAAYARRDAFVPKATMLEVGLAIPLFNRNQGNIKAAKAGIGQAKTEADLKELLIENELQSAYQKALNTNKTLLEMDETYLSNYETLLKSVQQNLEKQRISLLDFAQYQESFKESILQYYRLKNEKMNSIEELNYAIGKFLFN